MENQEQKKTLAEPVTIGQFEFSSVNLGNSVSKDINHSVMKHVYTNNWNFQ